MAEFLSRGLAVVLEHGHVLEADVVFQVLYALRRQREELADLGVARRRAARGQPDRRPRARAAGAGAQRAVPGGGGAGAQRMNSSFFLRSKSSRQEARAYTNV